MSREDIRRVNRAAEAIAGAAQTPERLLLSGAIYDSSEFNRAEPEHSTAWAHPGEDWARTCTCELTNAELADHRCPSQRVPVGDRPVALTRAVGRRQVADGEIMRLTSDYGDDGMFGLTVSQAEREHYAATGVALPDGSFPVPDAGHLRAAEQDYHAGKLAGHSREEVAAHIRKRGHELGETVMLSAASESFGMAAMSWPSAFSDASRLHGVMQAMGLAAMNGPSAFAEASRLHDVMHAMGLESAQPLHHVGKRYHGRPGSGKRVTSGQRAHARELHGEHESHPGTNDPDQPGKGGRVHPGVAGGIYETDLGGGPEEISRNPEYAHMFKGKLADRSKFGQRDRGLAR